MNQKGNIILIVFIIVAVLVGLGAITYGYYIVNKNSAPAQTPLPSTGVRVETLKKLGTPGCPDTDYTGCDTSGDFMTWKDDGLR